MSTGEVTLRLGFEAAERPRIAAIYHGAFRRKLVPALGSDDEIAQAFVAAVIDPAFAIVADSDGVPVGIAGYKTIDGAFTGGKGAWRLLVEHYGTARALWASAILSLLERPADPRILLMDGIAVAPEARGQGVGTALLTGINAVAARHGHEAVRLDVIDANPRARALYEREGFVATERTGLGVFAWAFGFREVTTMLRPVRAPTP